MSKKLDTGVILSHKKIKDNDKCIVCNSFKFSKKYLNINECLDCGHVFADYHLTNNEIKKIYNLNYFKGKEYLNYSDDKLVFQKNFNLRLITLFNYITKPENKSLLEIGCAFGFL